MDAHATTMGTATTRRQAEFHALLEAHRRLVFKVAGTYARHPDDRADLAQEIAAQLWRAFPGYDATRSFSTWMYRIALNVAISQVRSNAPRQQNAVALDEQLHDVADERAADPEAAQRLRALNRLIAALEPLNRALLLLYLEERSYREIGEVLGLSETNVATKIARLKQRIRTDLAD
jgi:RNA polymerase sigma-70 factor (ECF subfamily)